MQSMWTPNELAPRRQRQNAPARRFCGSEPSRTYPEVECDAQQRRRRACRTCQASRKWHLNGQRIPSCQGSGTPTKKRFGIVRTTRTSFQEPVSINLSNRSDACICLHFFGTSKESGYCRPNLWRTTQWRARAHCLRIKSERTMTWAYGQLGPCR